MSIRNNFVKKNSRDRDDFAVSVEEVAKHREEELTMFMDDWQEEVDIDSGDDWWFELDKSIATMFATNCAAIHDLRAEEQGDDYLPTPPVLPHEFMETRNDCFKDNLAKQKDRLLYQFESSRIDDIELPVPCTKRVH